MLQVAGESQRSDTHWDGGQHSVESVGPPSVTHEMVAVGTDVKQVAFSHRHLLRSHVMCAVLHCVRLQGHFPSFFRKHIQVEIRLFPGLDSPKCHLRTTTQVLKLDIRLVE